MLREGCEAYLGGWSETLLGGVRYTIDIEKEVDKLIEDPSRPRRLTSRRGRRRDGQQTCWA